jgi:3-oxoacyl-[acyl-carrier-protein] synthase-3
MERIDSLNRFDLPYDWLEKVSGIKERRISPDGISPSDMAVVAAKEALDRASLNPSELDVIIYAGVIRDYYVEPATAHAVQAKLGASKAVVFDVSNACHGFMNGIHLMDALIATGQARRGLVVSGEQNKILIGQSLEALGRCKKEDFKQLASGLTLGDAGAAAVMGPKLGPDSGFLGFMLQSQGQHADLCTCGGPNAQMQSLLLTDMVAITAASTNLSTAMFKEFMGQRLKWGVEELSRCFIHQIGKKSFKLHSEILGIPTGIMPDTVTTMGNITTATIPLNIHNALITNEIAAGDKVLLSGVGSGVSLSQAGMVWDAA